MQLLFTPKGREQFWAAVTYLHRDNSDAAKAFRKKAEKASKRLLAFPKSGRLLPEFPELPYREVIVAPYRLFYLVTETAI